MLHSSEMKISESTKDQFIADYRHSSRRILAGVDVSMAMKVRHLPNRQTAELVKSLVEVANVATIEFDKLQKADSNILLVYTTIGFIHAGRSGGLCSGFMGVWRYPTLFARIANMLDLRFGSSVGYRDGVLKQQLTIKPLATSYGEFVDKINTAVVRIPFGPDGKTRFIDLFP